MRMRAGDQMVTTLIQAESIPAKPQSLASYMFKTQMNNLLFICLEFIRKTQKEAIYWSFFWISPCVFWACLKHCNPTYYDKLP